MKKSGHDEVEPDRALHRGLLVHLAADQEGRRADSRRSACRSASRRCAPTASSRRPARRDAQACAPRGLTFAPEAGTQRMRDVVNKNVTEEQLHRDGRARVLARLGQDEALLHDRPAHRRRRGRARHRRRSASARSQVGKRVAQGNGRRGHRQRLDPRAEAAHAVSVVRDGHRSTRSRASSSCCATRRARRRASKLRTHDADDERARRHLRARRSHARRRARARLPRAARASTPGTSSSSSTSGRRRFDALRHRAAPYLGTIPVTARLPWDHIDVGLEDGFLAREYRKALKSRLARRAARSRARSSTTRTSRTPNADTRRLVCYDCGVACDLGAMRDERVVFLRKLGAKTPRVPREARRRRRRCREKARRARPPTHRARAKRGAIRFASRRSGRSALLSHLDLIRALPRAFRRLEVPHLLLGGLPSEARHDLRARALARRREPRRNPRREAHGRRRPARLSRASSRASLRKVCGGRRGIALSAADRGLAKAIDGARYAVGIPRKSARRDRRRSTAPAEVERVLEATEIRLVRRFERGLAKAVDAKALPPRALAGDARAAAFLDDAQVAGDLVPLLVDVDVTGEGGVKIAEVMEALFGKNADGDITIPYHAVRAELGLWNEGRLVSPIERIAASTSETESRTALS